MNLTKTIERMTKFQEEISVGVSFATVEFQLRQQKHVLFYLSSTNQGFDRTSMMGLVQYAYGSRRSATTAGRIIAYAKRFAAWLYNNDIEPRDSGRGIRVRNDTPIHKAPTLPFEKYHKALMQEDPAIAYLFALSYFTGMALCDCCNLRWEHIDLDAGIIRIHRRKSGTSAEIPLKDNSVLMDHIISLQEDYERNPPDHFSFDPEGTPNTLVCTKLAMCWRTGKSLHNRLKRCLRVSGLPSMTWHDIRRAFISRLIKRGVQPIFIARMVGHKTVNQVMHYTTLDDETIRSNESHIYEAT